MAEFNEQGRGGIEWTDYGWLIGVMCADVLDGSDGRARGGQEPHIASEPHSGTFALLRCCRQQAYVFTQAIDTGSSLILVSDDVAKQFYGLVSYHALLSCSQALKGYGQIPGAQDASATYGGGFYTYPCTSTVTSSLIFSGRLYAIHNDDMNLGKLSDDSECVPVIPDCQPARY